MRKLEIKGKGWRGTRVQAYRVSKTLTIMECLNGKEKEKKKETVVHNMVVLIEKNILVFATIFFIHSLF